MPCVLHVNDEPNARWKAYGYWCRLMLPTAWPRTSGEVSILRSPALENRLGPLRGVGDPSEVMLKLIVAELGKVGRWFRSERLPTFPGYMVKSAVLKAAGNKSGVIGQMGR